LSHSKRIGWIEYDSPSEFVSAAFPIIAKTRVLSVATTEEGRSASCNPMIKKRINKIRFAGVFAQVSVFDPEKIS